MTQKEYEEQKRLVGLFENKKLPLEKRIGSLYAAYHKGTIDKGFVKHLSQCVEIKKAKI